MLAQVWRILDGTKWHRSALLPFVSMGSLTGTITDSRGPVGEIDSWREARVDVVVADAEATEPLLVTHERQRGLRLLFEASDGRNPSPPFLQRRCSVSHTASVQAKNSRRP